MTRNDHLAMRCWVEENLDVNTANMPLSVARRWQQLLMRNDREFFAMAIYGFVQRRRRGQDEDTFPDGEFSDFCAQFAVKLKLVLAGRGRKIVMPMFDRVAKQTVLRAQRTVALGAAETFA